MGIPGLLNELGPGERISLSKLAITHLEQTSRPLRIAIDISIWLFQIQACRGGANPELRTLFFRLLKLLGLPIHPVFVFDGDQKPLFKRGKAVGQNKGGQGNASALSVRLSKRLIDLFSFPRHTAPGEAEAECARLQEAGVVDAVMSDDIDTLMFGSRVTIMNFSKENSSVATHVNLYRTEEGNERQVANVVLNKSEMILFAMLSGGDYLPSGIPKCGQKTAAEIAKAGFGTDLMKAIEEPSGNSDVKLAGWRQRLQHELNENESGFFKRRHRSVKIPESFPDRVILSYYTNPIVSKPEVIEKLRQKMVWDREIDMIQLQKFTEDTLGWSSAASLKRFIKLFYGPLVLHRLRLKRPLVSAQGKMSSIASGDAQPEQKVYKKRAIYGNDGIPELQFEFIPADIVGLDLDTETTDSPQKRGGGEAPAEQGSDDESDLVGEDLTGKKRPPREYDPLRPERIWVFEVVAELGALEAVTAWRLEQQRKEAALSAVKAKKAASKTKKTKQLESGMRQEEIFRYASRVKPVSDATAPSSSAVQSSLSPQSSRNLPSATTKPVAKRTPRKKKTSGLLSSPKVDKTINPFSLARAQAKTRSSGMSTSPSYLRLGNREWGVPSSIADTAQSDGFVEDNMSLPGSSPPPLPPKRPIFSGQGEIAATGTTADAILISSSSPRPAFTSHCRPMEVAPEIAAPTRSQGKQEAQLHDFESNPSEPQTPPISSGALPEDFPFPSPSNITTPTPKPRTRAHEAAPGIISSPQMREELHSGNEDDGDNDSYDKNQISDPFISFPHMDMPAFKETQTIPPINSKSSTVATEPLISPESTTKPDDHLSQKAKGALSVDSYGGYWTFGQDEVTSRDLLDSDASNATTTGSPKGKKKSQRKKFERVSILDLS